MMFGSQMIGVGEVVHQHPIRLDLARDTYVSRLVVRIFVHPEVFLGKLIDLDVSALFSHFDDAPANVQVTIRDCRDR
jgi:hypothetical protein